MDKKQNLTSFQELTTTELNQITGGGLWEDLLYNINPKSFIPLSTRCNLQNP
ncbi:peptide pheromone BlpC (bacteriocin-like peptide) [Streptococcus pneumoniae]|nr:peptide pheromone BlpC (bacteriocin-like peptide) [Streptococcus pneumoniae]VTA83289.1 peptide pheromone BlpC (bacteriocin-like peptide) [Streptococcus pneumoniae]